MIAPPEPAVPDAELRKGADSDVLRQMLAFVAQRLMEFDVEGRCGAAYGERSDGREVARNGYRDRRWETRAGAIDLKIPKLRRGSYFPPFLEPRRRAPSGLADPKFLEMKPADVQLLDAPRFSP